MPSRISLSLALFLILLMLPLSASSRHLNEGDTSIRSLNKQSLTKEWIFLPAVSKSPLEGWPMAGANTERTSWAPQEVRGKLTPVWYRPIEPYIPQRVQIIAAYNTLYIATSAGLYALDAETGGERWIYPTEMPLGHSPTIHNGVAYVGGFDRKLHAIDAFSGEGLWTFDGAGAGYQTSPLVVNDIAYLGNRDGVLYAVHTAGAQAGQLAWKYETDGPILYSAAYKDGVVFFASNDSHAYALDARTGTLVWKSKKLAGSGFYSWWPVVYKDRVIFSGSNNYPSSTRLGPGKLHHLELEDVYPAHETDPRGTLVGTLGEVSGDWVDGTPTIDASRILNYFAQKPWRKTVFVLDRYTGEERETAPVLWAGNDGAISRYPPVVGADGVLYQHNNYMSDHSIAGGQAAGWQPGLSHISVISSDWNAVDEPSAYSAGGNLVYRNLCCDRAAGAFDVTIANSEFAERYRQGRRPPTGGKDRSREWVYFGYDLDQLIPGYNIRYYNPGPEYSNGAGTFGGPNGVYGFHSDQNPPIPYADKVYMHRSNAVIAFGNEDGAPVALPMAPSVEGSDTDPVILEMSEIQARLALEVQRILDAGHLRPGFVSHGNFDVRARIQCGDSLVDYWHQPADTINTLLMTLPYLPVEMQQEVRDYLQREFNSYPPYEYNHIGWRDGAPREIFDLPPEVAATLSNYSPESENYAFKNNGGWQDGGVWGRNPYSFYALWKYAATFGNAGQIFQASRDKLAMVPQDGVLLNMPLVHNAYIAGYLGYLELEKLAGQPESTDVRNELQRLMELRVTHFDKDSAYGDFYETARGSYCRTLSVSSNFIYLVPELASYLRQHALSDVQAALAHYEEIAPYWFVSLASEGYAENPKSPLYDPQAIFAAKALILQEPADELQKYIDVPAFARGDLYYIQRLVLTLAADSGSVPSIGH